MNVTPAEARSSGSSGRAIIVKEGWLFKRGEHIKNWRSR